MSRFLVTGGFKNIFTSSYYMIKRDENGKFLRTRNEWSLKNFNDGYVDAKGRFRVYSPNSPRSYVDGYILRSLVAWETYHKKIIPAGYQIHHKNKNKLDDSKKNLELVKASEHMKLHFTNSKVERICKTCDEKFLIFRWRLKDKSRGKYCSQDCYKNRVFESTHKENISTALKKAYAEGRR